MPSKLRVSVRAETNVRAVCCVTDKARMRVIRASRTSVFLCRFGRWGAAIARPTGQMPEAFDVEFGGRGPSGRTDVQVIDRHPDQHAIDAHVHWTRLEALEEASITAAPTPEHKQAANYWRDLDISTNAHIIRDRRPGFQLPSDWAEILANKVHRAVMNPGTSNRLVPNELDLIKAVLAPILLQSFPNLEQADASSAVQSDIEAATLSHILFGAGELAIRIGNNAPSIDITKRLSNGSPDGLFLLSFAEYALQCLEHNRSDTIVWARTLPGIIGACRAFLACYCKPTGGNACALTGGTGMNRPARPKFQLQFSELKQLAHALLQQSSDQDPVKWGRHQLSMIRNAICNLHLYADPKRHHEDPAVGALDDLATFRRRKPAQLVLTDLARDSVTF